MTLKKLPESLWYFFALLLVVCCVSSGYAKKIKYTPVSDPAALKNYVGKKVIVEGKISKIPWQHLVNPPKTHPVDYYFDMEKFQIVIYAKEKIACDKTLKVFGEVIELRGAGKGSKADETFKEYHVVVDSWKCFSK